MILVAAGSAGEVELGRFPVAGMVRVPSGARQTVPFSVPVPLHTPFTVLYGQSSLIAIVVAALMLVVTFNQIEEGVAAGLPRKYGWLGAFGILVELVWLYLEILRLISYFQED